MSFATIIRNAIRNKPDTKPPIVAVLEKGGILSIGTNNKTKSHTSTFGGSYSRCIHAEVDALRKYRGNLDGCRLWVIRFLASGEFGTSYPCEVCRLYIEEELRRRGGGKITIIYYEDEWKRYAIRA